MLLKKEKILKPKSFRIFGGDKRDRTADLLNAIQALSQLSYTPRSFPVGTFDSIAREGSFVNYKFSFFENLFWGRNKCKRIVKFWTHRENYLACFPFVTV